MKLLMTEDNILKYLDSCIDYWRKTKVEKHLGIKEIYVDVYQAVRIALYGKDKKKS